MRRSPLLQIGIRKALASMNITYRMASPSNSKSKIDSGIRSLCERVDHPLLKHSLSSSPSQDHGKAPRSVLAGTELQSLSFPGQKMDRGRNDSPQREDRPNPAPMGRQEIESPEPFPGRSPSHWNPNLCPWSILHEDPSIIVIDKPAGLVVHPAPGKSFRNTGQRLDPSLQGPCRN